MYCLNQTAQRPASYSHSGNNRIEQKKLEVFYLSDDKYESHIKAVLSECPDADTDEVKAAFIKYEEEFYIPPQDALRSIIRRFQADQAPKPSAASSQQPRQTKRWHHYPN